MNIIIFEGISNTLTEKEKANLSYKHIIQAYILGLGCMSWGGEEILTKS